MAKARKGQITNWELMAKQVQFYRDHLDIFLQEQYPPIKLTKTQHVIAREFGKCNDAMFVCSRGYGKTWLTAVMCFAVCVLYPETRVIVTSPTASQATLVLGKIKELIERNKNMVAELSSTNQKTYVRLQKDKSSCQFKNGSSIQSYSLESARGQRAKIVVVDERLDTPAQVISAVVEPIKNFRRPISRDYGFQDYPSKTVSISSASTKSNPMYDDFKRLLKNMAEGDMSSFACALSYEAAVYDGITDIQFFQKERQRQSQEVFNVQYGSIFVGANENSAFPYQLVEKCRTLTKVQLQQPKNSKSRYVMGVDLATSQAKVADNSIISVVKFTERSDGTFLKKLVYMRSFHGVKLDEIAAQVRTLLHIRFPNIQKVVYDARGLGDSFSLFLNESWTDVMTNKQYPPLADDDKPVTSSVARYCLHPIRAIQSLNQGMYTTMRVNLEKKLIELPIKSRALQSGQQIVYMQDQRDGNGKKTPMKDIPMTMEQKAIFIQADALQYEMGNIVAKIGASGKVLYDTPSLTKHKDRYSSLAMAMLLINSYEQENIRLRNQDDVCIGITSYY